MTDRKEKIHELEKAVNILKQKHGIYKLGVDGIYRVEIIYKHSNITNWDWENYLVVDDDDKPIDFPDASSRHDEVGVIKTLLEICKSTSLYIRRNFKHHFVKQLLLDKGTSLEKLLVENDLNVEKDSQ